MYTLHYAPDNASLIIRLLLEANGLPYATTLVDRSIRQQDSAAYRALNPQGLIPVLETPQGPLSETGAILLWLADRHGLCPTPDQKARLPFLKWLFFLSNTVHADLRQMFYAHRYCPPEALDGHHALMAARMKVHFAELEAAAAAEPALFAPFSPIACYAVVLLRWSVLYPIGQRQWRDLAATPRLAALAAAMETAPAALAAGTAEGLGPTPFTAPQYPTPPEGSAL